MPNEKVKSDKKRRQSSEIKMMLKRIPMTNTFMIVRCNTACNLLSCLRLVIWDAGVTTDPVVLE
eukprot:1436320-Karenia_brevis.AAC.1